LTLPKTKLSIGYLNHINEVKAMIFFANKLRPECNYDPIYIKKDQSFSSIPEIPSEFSIMIKGNYTSLDISLNTSTLCCVSGFNPQNTWIEAHLSCPEFVKCAVQVEFDFEPQLGMGMDYAVDWKTYYDRKQGVICIGTYLLPCNSVNVEFNRNTGVSIVDGKIIALWIKPSFL
jgi:hypothetical protein